LSAEAEQQRLSAVDSTVNVVNIQQSERARESETMDASSRVVDEKDRRAAASALRKEAVNASRISDPISLDMQRAPSGEELTNFEHDPVQSVLMMHAIFGNDFLLSPPPRNMTDAQELEYKDNLYEQCAVSDEARQACIDAYKEQMSSERYVVIFVINVTQ